MKKTLLIIISLFIIIFLCCCGKIPIEVKFDANGGQTSSTNLYLKEGEDVSLPLATKEGKEFIGWFDIDGNQVTTTSSITNNLTLYAKWDSYDITYYSDGKFYKKITVNHDTKIVYPDANPKKNPDEKHAYKFDGWDVDEDKIINSDLTVNAIWLAEDIMWAKIPGTNPISRPMFRLSYIYKDSLFDQSTSTFNKDLALFAFGAANNTDDVTTISSFYSSLSFDDIYISQTYSQTPTTSSIAYCFAHKQVKDSDVICVTVRGQNYKLEWVNNFMVGEAGDHTGFADSASLVKADLDQYLSKYMASTDLKVLITGYSRGGGVANNLAHKYLSSQNSLLNETNLYVYTFEAPASIAISNNINYPNVFNLINSADIVCYVPPMKYGLVRCGIDIELYDNNLDAIARENGYLAKLPSFEAKAGSYANDVAFAKYVIDTLTNYNGQASSSLNNRDLYYTNYQESICYLLSIMIQMKKETTQRIINDLQTRSKVELAGLLTGNGLYNYLSSFIKSDGVSYNDTSLSNACNNISKLISGPGYSLITDLAGSNNLNRMLAMHDFEITYSLLVNLEYEKR